MSKSNRNANEPSGFQKLKRFVDGFSKPAVVLKHKIHTISAGSVFGPLPPVTSTETLAVPVHHQLLASSIICFT